MVKSMSEPKAPRPVKLSISLFSRDIKYIEKAARFLSKEFGTIDFLSNIMPFDKTDYYHKEMGSPLIRRMVFFKNLISPVELAKIKLFTNLLEKDLSEGGNRTVNIDPGILCLERFILATGKNYSHRIYLAHGIYADLTLIYKKGTYLPLEWTYSDYKSPEMITLLNLVRKKLLFQLKENL